MYECMNDYAWEMDSVEAIAKISEAETETEKEMKIGLRPTGTANRRRSDKRAITRKVSILRDKYKFDPKTPGKYNKTGVEASSFLFSFKPRTQRGCIATWKASDRRKLESINFTLSEA